ncbi:MAG: leucine-rich repeat domain-containing protein [Proteobacteria bacterium]|nr:leucine-rich repeat domain-containing protein [Pseudomonadota bacterium]
MITLPQDILNTIMSYLSEDDKKNLRFTCNLFYETVGKEPSIIIIPLLNRLKAIDKHVSLIPPVDAAKNPKWAMERFVAEFNRIANLQSQEILSLRDNLGFVKYLSRTQRQVIALNLNPATTLKELEAREEILDEINAKKIDGYIDINYPHQLVISNLGLTRFPESVFKMHPPAFWSMLTEIDCHSYHDRNTAKNKITELPTSLAEHCPRLQKINCADNHIKELPDSLATCAQLQTLICDNNYLSSRGIPPVLVNKLGTQWQQRTLATQKQKPSAFATIKEKTKSAFKRPDILINRIEMLIDAFSSRFGMLGKTFYCITRVFDLNAIKDFDSFSQALEQHALRYSSESPFHGDIIFYPFEDIKKANAVAHELARSWDRAAFIITLNMKHLLTKKAQKYVHEGSRSSVLWEDENVTYWSINKIQYYNLNAARPLWSNNHIASKPILWKNNLFKVLLNIVFLLASTLVGAAVCFAGLGLSTGMSFFGSLMFFSGFQFLKNKLACNAFFEFIPNLNKVDADYVFETKGSQKGSLKTYFDLGKEAQNSWNAYVKSACYQTYLPTKHGRAFKAGRKAQEITNRAKAKNKP